MLAGRAGAPTLLAGVVPDGVTKVVVTRADGSTTELQVTANTCVTTTTGQFASISVYGNVVQLPRSAATGRIGPSLWCSVTGGLLGIRNHRLAARRVLTAAPLRSTASLCLLAPPIPPPRPSIASWSSINTSSQHPSCAAGSRLV